jgi:xanthine dehydrogenase YagT iron-sulfur-binding subunit
MSDDGEKSRGGGNGRKPGSGVSRRGFLKGAGVAVSAVTVLREGLLSSSAAAADAKVAGPGAVAMTLKINGADYKITVEPRVTLLDALRNHLDITGAKKVCDRATCGACTVIVDGRVVYACTMLAIEAQGRDIQTIEGLAPEGQLHPVSAAFVDHDAQQCGFCTPGFVMAVKSFIDTHPNPTREEIRTGFGGNLCRCGTYAGVREAVLDAAGRMRGGRA